MSKVTYDADAFQLTIDDDQVAEALGELKGKTNAVLKVAINRTARQARKDVIAAATERYDLTAKGKEKLRRLKMRRKATNAVLMAELRQDDKGLPLDYAYFRHSPRTVFKGWHVRHAAPEYVRGRVLKSQPMRNLAAETNRHFGQMSKGFLVEFKSGHIGMVQRVIGSRSASSTTARGYRRWEPNERLETMARPGGSGMGRAAWNLSVEEATAENLMLETERRLEEVVAKARRKV